jgi:hypothetical protein
MLTCECLHMIFEILTAVKISMLEAVGSSEKLVSTYKSTWHYNPEEQ